MDYRVVEGASPYSRDGETTISMVNPRAGVVMHKADAKRANANALLGEVGARALGPNPKGNPNMGAGAQPEGQSQHGRDQAAEGRGSPCGG